jgi:hypothetical protein
MFVLKYGNDQWNLCWNELLNKWITQYTWFPEFSENINNIFYTFATEIVHPNKGNILYKHGFAGNEGESIVINPTNWYGTTHPFEFEFVAIGVQGVQKIFNNLKIISNLVAPQSFEFEIVGEGFGWTDLKSQILPLSMLNGQWLSKESTMVQYAQYMQGQNVPKKIPFIWSRDTSVNGINWPENNLVLRDLSLREHNKTREKLIQVYQKGNDIKTQGRLKGNMQYVEDSWDVQIQPITFKYVYLKDGVLSYSIPSEMKIRDKYIKIRVKYAGNQYAIINALKTFFTISYA